MINEKEVEKNEVVNHEESALFSLAVDIVASYYLDEETKDVVCRKVRREPQGKIIH